jgi:hypothetical protein
MPRRFKRNQLSHVKEALNQQKTAEAEANEVEDSNSEVHSMSKDDVKKAFKESAESSGATTSVKKQMRKVRRNLKRQNVSTRRTVSWQHEVGDLVKIPERASRIDDEDYGIIVQMTDPNEYNETQMYDSQSLVLSPAGRNWYRTKNLRKV